MEIKINLKLKNDVSVELTGDEAKELYEFLDNIYGKKNQPYYPYPIIIERPWKWWEPIITYYNTDGTSYTSGTEKSKDQIIITNQSEISSVDYCLTLK
jgi:hypothetical protein